MTGTVVWSPAFLCLCVTDYHHHDWVSTLTALPTSLALWCCGQVAVMFRIPKPGLIEAWWVSCSLPLRHFGSVTVAGTKVGNKVGIIKINKLTSVFILFFMVMSLLPSYCHGNMVNKSLLLPLTWYQDFRHQEHVREKKLCVCVCSHYTSKSWWICVFNEQSCDVWPLALSKLFQAEVFTLSLTDKGCSMCVCGGRGCSTWVSAVLRAVLVKEEARGNNDGCWSRAEAFFTSQTVSKFRCQRSRQISACVVFCLLSTVLKTASYVVQSVIHNR